MKWHYYLREEKMQVYNIWGEGGNLSYEQKKESKMAGRKQERRTVKP